MSKSKKSCNYYSYLGVTLIQDPEVVTWMSRNLITILNGSSQPIINLNSVSESTQELIAENNSTLLLHSHFLHAHIYTHSALEAMLS